MVEDPSKESRTCDGCRCYRRGECAGLGNPNECHDYVYAGKPSEYWPTRMQGGYGSTTKGPLLGDMKRNNRHMSYATAVAMARSERIKEERSDATMSYRTIIHLYREESSNGTTWCNAYDEDAELLSKLMHYKIYNVNGHKRTGCQWRYIDNLQRKLNNMGYGYSTSYDPYPMPVVETATPAKPMTMSDRESNIASLVSQIKSQYADAVVLMHFTNEATYFVYGDDVIKLRWILENQLIYDENLMKPSAHIRLREQPLDILRKYDIHFVVVECGDGRVPCVTEYR